MLIAGWLPACSPGAVAACRLPARLLVASAYRLLPPRCFLLAAACWLLAAGCCLLAAGCCLLAAGLLAAGWLSAGCWLLAGWLLAAGRFPHMPFASSSLILHPYSFHVHLLCSYLPVPQHTPLSLCSQTVLGSRVSEHLLG